MGKNAAGTCALRRLPTALVIALGFAATAALADFTGEVVRILNGDTLEVLVDRKPVRIRLAQIDAPERGQPFGTRSQQALSRFIARKVVRVREYGRDRHGRVIGTVCDGGLDVGRAMVAEGYAWADPVSIIDASLLTLEGEARGRMRGLWAEKEPVPPWDWRAESHRQ